jgi:hypothetical protein
MTTEVQNSELYLATANLVENIFDTDVENMNSASTIVTDIFELPEYSLGSITSGGGEISIQLGNDELNQFANYFGFTEDSMPTIYRYVAASMFAGYLIANSVVGRDREFSEASEVFNQFLIDESKIASLFEDCAWRSFGSPGAPEEIYKRMSERDPFEIATVNMQRIGSGIVLLAEERLGLDSMGSVSNEMIEALNENILHHTKNDQLTLAAAGFSSSYAKAKIGHNVMERLIKQRGIGLAFPYSQVELNTLNESLYKAQRFPDEKERILRGELADEQSTSAWKEMVDLSGGHIEIDLDYMKVQYPED